MTNASQPSLRERTRRAVQKEIGDAALELFAERGYDSTTIDDIAAAVGMSQRSVFRYFATKEEIVVGKFDLGGSVMLELLHARPMSEPVWTTLRRLFDIIDSADQHTTTKGGLRVIFETPALLAVFLQRLQGIQQSVVEALVQRAESPATTRSEGPADARPALRALTGAAFGCVVAAMRTWLDDAIDDTLAVHIDRAMATLVARP